MEKRKYIPVDLAALEIGTTKKHVYTLLRAGRLIAIDISESGTGGSSSIRILRKSIEEFIKSRTINPQEFYK